MMMMIRNNREGECTKDKDGKKYKEIKREVNDTDKKTIVAY